MRPKTSLATFEGVLATQFCVATHGLKTPGLSEGWHFTTLGGNVRSIARTSCNVKDVVKSSTVTVESNLLNQPLVVVHLPKASIEDLGYRRTRRLTDFAFELEFDFVKLGDNVTVLWSVDPSGANTWGVS